KRKEKFSFVFLIPLVLPRSRPTRPSAGRRRSVSHAQLMHDKGRSMQELKRRLWLQELLEEVHTAEERAPPAHGGGGASPDFSGNDLRQKPPEATKDLPHRFGPEREGPVLPQETHKASAYKDQPLKVATKRKKKARLGRRREGDKKRRRTRSVPTPD
uniref:Parathyroid hormone-like hormone b n=1 Tax=Hippocampus comes TaxID=109280 RepID=A0A3Q3DLI0_HIPCM